MSLREQIEKMDRFAPGSAGKMCAKDDGRWIPRLEVLRIVAEHEKAMASAIVVPAIPVNADDDRLMGAMLNQANAKPVLDLTPGGVGKQMKREPSNDLGEFRPGLPSEVMRKVWPEWDARAVYGDHPSVTITFRGTEYSREDYPRFVSIDHNPSWADFRFRPRGKTWAEVERMANGADVPRWRRELADCRRHAKELADLGAAGCMADVHPDDARLHKQLEILDKLHQVIESGRGQAVVPDAVGVVLGLYPTEGWRVSHFIENDAVLIRDQSHDRTLVKRAAILAACNSVGDSLCGAA